MKIATLLPSLAGGGVERVRIDLAREFTARGHDVTFVLMRAKGDLLQEASAEFEVVDLAAPRLRQAFRPLRTWLRSRRPDALLAGIWPMTVLGIAAARFSGINCRVVVSDHSILSLQYAKWGRIQNRFLRASIAIGYPRADARVGVSRGVADDVAALGRLNRETVEVIHNPIKAPSTENVAGTAAADAAWSAGAGKRLLTVGKFKTVKNHVLLLRAFSRLCETTDAQLMLLGEGAMRAELEQVAAAEGIADRVLMPGFVADPAPYYRSADLFVLSSDFEGFGNVIVEALACGTPVVSTDCPSGPREILEDGKHGVLVPVGDEEALAAAMEQALVMEHDPDALRARARDFAPDIAASKYLALLEGKQLDVH